MISTPDVNPDQRATYAALMKQFGDGWQKLSSRLIASVFSENAVFVPDPYGSSVEGQAAIAKYWEDIPYEQSEVHFRFGEIYQVGPWFSTEFKCTFRRRRTGEEIDVRGALFCETHGDKISEMRMYWDRRVRS